MPIHNRFHKWRGVFVERALWLRITLGWWTLDFLPSPIAERVSRLLDELWKRGDRT
jgi:hypothetical protein